MMNKILGGGEVALVEHVEHGNFDSRAFWKRPAIIRLKSPRSVDCSNDHFCIGRCAKEGCESAWPKFLHHAATGARSFRKNYCGESLVLKPIAQAGNFAKSLICSRTIYQRMA